MDDSNSFSPGEEEQVEQFSSFDISDDTVPTTNDRYACGSPDRGAKQPETEYEEHSEVEEEDEFEGDSNGFAGEFMDDSLQVADLAGLLDHMSIGRNYKGASKLSEVERLRKELTDCRVQLRLQNELLREQLGDDWEGATQIQELKARVESLLEDQKDSAGEIDDLRTEKEELERRLDAVEGEREEALGRAQNVQSLLDEQGPEIEQLRKELERAVMEREAAITEKEATIRERDAAVQEKESAVEAKEVAVQAKEAAVQAKEAAIMDASAMRDSAESKYSDYDELVSQVEDLQRETDELHGAMLEMDQLQHENGQLRNQVKQQAQMLEAEQEDAMRDIEVLQAQQEEVVGTLLTGEINFETHAVKVLSRLLDKKSIREAAEKILQVANRDELALDTSTAGQLVGAVHEYILQGLETIVESHLSVSRELEVQVASVVDSNGEGKGGITPVVLPPPVSAPAAIPVSSVSSVASTTSATSAVPVLAPASKENIPPSVSPRGKLRVDELTRRWKAAEEALSFERRQSKRRLDSLVEENGRLRSKVDVLEDMRRGN